jgi:lysophospholipase L1-like esterase
LALVAVGSAVASAAGPSDESLRSDLEAVSRLRVFFGHQSVGANVLDGLSELSASAGVPLRVVEVAGAKDLVGPGIGHELVGENGDPRSKLAAFERALPAGSSVDVALLKFCYVDIGAGTDAAQLFAEYQEIAKAVRSRNPGTVLVHVTAPLRADQGWLKTTVKRLLGRGPGVAPDNLVRDRFNALLRRAYQGREPVFDLARVESTRPDGALESTALDGHLVPLLVPEYTDDGGHLNGAGRARAARELLRVLAALDPRGALRGRSERGLDARPAEPVQGPTLAAHRVARP